MGARILIADDHRILREGLAALLRGKGFDVVAAVGNGREALASARRLVPDACVLDISMPLMNGTEAARGIRRALPDVRIVMLSMHSDAEHVFQAREAGAIGYVLKDSASEELVAAVRAALAGREYLSAAVRLPGRRAAAPGPLASLSPRERLVLQLVVEGKSSAEIARIVNLSPKSVETYRSRLMRKLDVGDITALVKFALRHGLTPG